MIANSIPSNASTNFNKSLFEIHVFFNKHMTFSKYARISLVKTLNKKAYKLF